MAVFFRFDDLNLDKIIDQVYNNNINSLNNNFNNNNNIVNNNLLSNRDHNGVSANIYIYNMTPWKNDGSVTSMAFKGNYEGL